MTGTEAISHIQAVSWMGSKPGLERIHALLTALDHPERRLKFIHIAGTNGKGSTAAMLAAVFRQAGYRTGLFTSPYLQRFHERMQVDGQPIPDAELGAVTEQVAPLAETMTDRPTEFEMMTAVALQWFAARQCQIVVLETGLGGRLDATNIIQHPEVCVITAIGLDHTAVLGDSLPLIAAEKAGILKPGVPAVLYQAPEEVQAVVQHACHEKNCPLTVADFPALRVREDALTGQVFDYGPWKGLRLSLLGGHQRKNAAVVLETVTQLRRLGWAIPDQAVYDGLAAARWPGRFEILCYAPIFLADGGHNPQCAEALAANLAHYFPGKPIRFLLGVMADKDWHTVMNTVAPFACAFYTVTPDNPRALPAAELGTYLEQFGKPVTAFSSVPAGVRAVLSDAGPDDVICSFGSLFLTGEVRTLMGL